MPGRGSRGKLLRSFPPLPPPLEIAARFPHSHSFDDDDPETPATQNRKEPSGPLTPILQAHPSMRIWYWRRKTGDTSGRVTHRADARTSDRSFLDFSRVRCDCGARRGTPGNPYVREKPANTPLAGL